MRKILFFPLLNMPSGHHQVADTIAGYLKNRNSNIVCKKIDLLSAWNPMVEKIITKTYLEWIHHFPKTYARVYKKMAHTSKAQRSYHYYDFLFLKKMKQIITEEKPDLIICTHAFPSYLLSRLKKHNQCLSPVINVYTDFFINDVWGRQEIDYHFVSSLKVKNALIVKNGVSEKQIFVTGIPVAEQFDLTKKPNTNSRRMKILISGGSVGLGNIFDLLQHRSMEEDIDYFILCGKNKNLYEKLKKLRCKNIHPLPYITSRDKMNELYNTADAIITKPGGVTVSEALRKGLPIFIHSALPGQEEINLTLLKKYKLVHELNDKQALNDQITAFFKDKSLTNQFNVSLASYLSELKDSEPDQIYRLINSLIDAPIDVINREAAL